MVAVADFSLSIFSHVPVLKKKRNETKRAAAALHFLLANIALLRSLF